MPADLRPDSPTIRVKGVALMGSVQVVRLPPPGTPRKFMAPTEAAHRPNSRVVRHVRQCGPLWVTSSIHWRACLRADII